MNRYNQRNLKLIALLLAFCHASGIIFNFFTVKVESVYIYDIYDMIACNVKFNMILIGYAGLVDAVLCIGFIVAFIVALQKIMFNVARKVMILTSCSAGSTFRILFMLFVCCTCARICYK